MAPEPTDVAVLRCVACGRKQVPDALDPFREPGVGLCPACLGTELVGDTVPGTGTVLTYSWYRDRITKHFDEIPHEIPYNIALIELPEGLLTFAGVDGVGLGELSVQQRVAAVYRSGADGAEVLRFVPAEA